MKRCRLNPCLISSEMADKLKSITYRVRVKSMFPRTIIDSKDLIS